MANLVVETTTAKDIIDITADISEQVKNLNEGMVFLNLLHTTAAITTADLDPGTDRDFLDFLESLVPDISWRHPHNPEHAPDHLLSSLIGTSLAFSVRNGQLYLGTWQRVVLVELDGPRQRQIAVDLISHDGGR